MRDGWDLPRLNAWTRYSAEHPPLHQLVASYLSYKSPPKEIETTEVDNESAAAFLLSLPELARR